MQTMHTHTHTHRHACKHMPLFLSLPLSWTCQRIARQLQHNGNETSTASSDSGRDRGNVKWAMQHKAKCVRERARVVKWLSRNCAVAAVGIAVGIANAVAVAVAVTVAVARCACLIRTAGSYCCCCCLHILQLQCMCNTCEAYSQTDTHTCTHKAPHCVCALISLYCCAAYLSFFILPLCLFFSPPSVCLLHSLCFISFCSQCKQ